MPRPALASLLLASWIGVASPGLATPPTASEALDPPGPTAADEDIRERLTEREDENRLDTYFLEDLLPSRSQESAERVQA